MRPLLYGAQGDVVAVETTDQDRKDEVLLELFGLLAGVPTCVERWKQLGGVEVATAQMVAAIVELLGKERIEKAWDVTIGQRPVPKTWADIERDPNANGMGRLPGAVGG